MNSNALISFKIRFHQEILVNCFRGKATLNIKINTELNLKKNINNLNYFNNHQFFELFQQISAKIGLFLSFFSFNSFIPFFFLSIDPLTENYHFFNDDQMYFLRSVGFIDRGPAISNTIFCEVSGEKKCR